MATDMAIIALSANLVVYLDIEPSRKLLVVACFAPRLLVIGAALARLVYLYPITPQNNPEFYLWVPTICAEIEICLSVSTACIPYIPLFCKGVEPRSWRAAATQQRGKPRTPDSGSTFLGIPKRGKKLHSIDSRSEERRVGKECPV